MHEEDRFAATLAGAKAGSELAWAALYGQLAGPVIGYLAARGAQDPEDLAAEAFLQIARNIASFEGDEASFRSWVFVIAHRRLIDMRRANGRRPQQTALPDHSNDYAGGDVEAEAIDNLVTAELMAVLSGLTDNQRDVLALRIIGDLTLVETATVVGKRVGAVKGLQRRGLIALREHLDQERVSI
jgi:RNA polymerase sigma-70 factor (ECF subfamily)